jgi:hypothetical protein
MLPTFRLLRRQGVEIFFFSPIFLSLLYIIMIISMPTHKSTPGTVGLLFKDFWEFKEKIRRKLTEIILIILIEQT